MTVSGHDHAGSDVVTNTPGCRECCRRGWSPAVGSVTQMEILLRAFHERNQLMSKRGCVVSATDAGRLFRRSFTPPWSNSQSRRRNESYPVPRISNLQADGKTPVAYQSRCVHQKAITTEKRRFQGKGPGFYRKRPVAGPDRIYVYSNPKDRSNSGPVRPHSATAGIIPAAQSSGRPPRPRPAAYQLRLRGRRRRLIGARDGKNARDNATRLHKIHPLGCREPGVFFIKILPRPPCACSTCTFS